MDESVQRKADEDLKEVLDKFFIDDFFDTDEWEYQQFRKALGNIVHHYFWLGKDNGKSS